MIKDKNKEKRIKLPEVTAKAWSVYDPITKSFFAGKEEKTKKDIASITKIMTCIVVLEIAEEQGVSLTKVITVPKSAVNYKGTTSNLQEHDELRIIDLIYGMMVPSGNDSSIALGIYFGQYYHDSLPLIGFVRVMNYMAEYLQLTDTFFRHPHGLSINSNYSTAYDVNLLASYALKNKIFRAVVKTQSYCCEVVNPVTGNRVAKWENTNKILGEDFDGIKTGTTNKAGACLCARVKDPIYPLIITVLGSESSENRWRDVVCIANWSKQYLSQY